MNCMSRLIPAEMPAPEEFMRVVSRCGLVLLDLKLADPQEHLRWTGCDNRLILHNLGLLAATDIPFIIRVPLIPGVTDTDQTLLSLAQILAALRPYACVV